MNVKHFPPLLFLFFLLFGLTFASSSYSHWIFFKPTSTTTRHLSDDVLLSRSLKGKILSDFDLDSNHPYITTIENILGRKVRVISRWLCAATIDILSQDELKLIQALDFVQDIDKVFTHKRPIPDYEDNIPESQAPYKRSVYNDELNYGDSRSQVLSINAIEAHKRNLTGKGVKILIIDSGFQVNHITFNRNRKNILGQRDFIHRDNDTSNHPDDDPDQHNHGTGTLSNIIGYTEGKIIGTAFDATIYLAKTEYTKQEMIQEEDLFVEAVEWGGELGVDVISASLGWKDWWTFRDLNGKNSRASMILKHASDRGILPVISQGNYGNVIMSAPADAIDIISVGATKEDGSLATFSSLGPTSDGRIKPEITAKGFRNAVARPGNEFSRASGTSFSCPTAAGGVALIVQAHPDWTPQQIREAIIKTSSNSETPNVKIGYGKFDVIAAINYDPLNLNQQCEKRCVHGYCRDGNCICVDGYYNYNCDAKKLNCEDYCDGTCFENTCICHTNSITQRCAKGDIPNYECAIETYNKRDGICNCGCGRVDPDCEKEYTSIEGCEEGETCINGECAKSGIGSNMIIYISVIGLVLTLGAFVAFFLLLKKSKRVPSVENV